MGDGDRRRRNAPFTSVEICSCVGSDLPLRRDLQLRELQKKWPSNERVSDHINNIYYARSISYHSLKSCPTIFT